MEEAAKPAVPEAQQKIDELTNDLQRLQAEFENYQKRTQKDFERVKQYSSAELMLKLLPVLDSFEFALKNSQTHKDYAKGIELIYSQLKAVLEQEGLRPIESVDKQFDAYRHEVVMQVPSEKDGIVLEELQKGYMLKDRVLRHSKVKVANADKQEHKEGDNTQAG